MYNVDAKLVERFTCSPIRKKSHTKKVVCIEEVMTIFSFDAFIFMYELFVFM